MHHASALFNDKIHRLQIMKEKQKILVIVGPTASGKTSLSINLAKKFNGEVVSADSRQVYKGLDIGTGKVTQDEMQGVPHHLLDVANLQDTYTVADFVRDGRNAINDIVSRRNLPIVVGGTFFYVDALLGRISTPEVEPNEALRAKLENMSTNELFELLERKDPVRAETIDDDNKRRLIRALEIVEALGVVPKTQPMQLYNTLILGIDISKEELKKNIRTRLITRINAGMVDEVIALQKNGLSYERMGELGIEYKYIGEFLQQKISREEMLTLIETKSWQYAKRQMTWLKRDKEIVWIKPGKDEEIERLVGNFIS